MRTQAKNKVIILGRAVNLFPETGQGKKIRDISAFVAMAIAAFMSQDVFADGGVMRTDVEGSARRLRIAKDGGPALRQQSSEYDQTCRNIKHAIDNWKGSSDNEIYLKAKRHYADGC